jgi:hypothetical protein
VKKHVIVIAVALLPVWTAAVAAQGGPPLATDDPGTPGPGNWELNLAWTIERAGDQNRLEVPVLDLNYGWGERVQLKAEVPWVWREGEGERRDGPGNAALGVKWRFLDEERHGTAVSIYPQLTFGGRRSAVERGLAEDDAELLLPFQFQKDFGWGKANLEMGYAFGDDGEDEWIYGLAVGREVARGVELLAEVNGTSPRARQTELIANLGGRWSLGEDVRLLFSAGRGFAAADAPDVLAYFGFQWTF